MSIKTLFVYGTLAPGRPNEHILKKIGGSWKKGSVSGKSLQEGWGADMGYPAIILDKKGDKIKVFLFSSDKLPEYWQELDAFEGEAYERVVAEVKLEDNTSTKAYIYALKK